MQADCLFATPLLSMFNKALHTYFVKVAATGVFGEDPMQQAFTQEDQQNSTYCTNYYTM